MVNDIDIDLPDGPADATLTKNSILVSSLGTNDRKFGRILESPSWTRLGVIVTGDGEKYTFDKNIVDLLSLFRVNLNAIVEISFSSSGQIDLVSVISEAEYTRKTTTIDVNVKGIDIPMPDTIKWFERSYILSIILGIWFSPVPAGAVSISLLIAFVLVLVVWWASRGRSNFARWFIAVTTLIGVIAIIPFLSIISQMGLQGTLVVIQTGLQLLGVYFLFSGGSASWFEREIST